MKGSTSFNITQSITKEVDLNRLNNIIPQPVELFRHAGFVTVLFREKVTSKGPLVYDVNFRVLISGKENGKKLATHGNCQIFPFKYQHKFHKLSIIHHKMGSFVKNLVLFPYS
jgi:hypothetical protein